ncbi:MAG: nitrogenase [Desulfacinum sp.]|nr:nitrogenase [Desulfacinum sp.]MBZ4658340.1 Nitrogenase [Desulfacinum sp.]
MAVLDSIDVGDGPRGPASYASVTNPCKLCAPLGAALAFRGLEGAVPFLHGSQGCATYMRRYVISHFREPMDVASSSLGEKDAVYGGGPNLKLGIKNILEKYQPRLVGVASTCLTETIGDDVPGIVKEFMEELGRLNPDLALPVVVTVSTPSYSGSHADGFHHAVRAVVETLAGTGPPLSASPAVNLMPGLLSPEDIRELKDILQGFGLTAAVVPDISGTLDGPALEDYPLVPQGGTPLALLRSLHGAGATVELGRSLPETGTAGTFLRDAWGVPLYRLGLPVGLRETDRFLEVLSRVSGRPVPERYEEQRGRLVDAYVDGHKVVFGQRAAVFGEEDLVVGITAFLAEIGVQPVLCASGGGRGRLRHAVRDVTADLVPEAPRVLEKADFRAIEEELDRLRPDLLIGHSKGYPAARRLGIPLIRVGFPVHDRFGAQRLLHVGYRGALRLLDQIVNTIFERRQEESPVGYGYL